MNMDHTIGVPLISTGRIRHRRRSNEFPPEFSKSNGSQFLINDQNKYRSMWIRAYSSMWMLGVVSVVIYLGHLYMWGMVVVIQIFMASELFNLLRRAREDKHLPGFRLLKWLVSGLLKYQMVICYFLYIAGFMWFILTLTKKMCKYQFGQYAWTHMILIVVFTQSAFTVANIFEGMFWCLLPASLIAINDVAAYFFGFFFGRTPLIKLSPKKTWEGFIGASVATVISAFMFANILGRFQWLTCPRKDLSTGWLQCDPDPLLSQSISPYRIGCLNGGFKRAFKIKDFGASIPGHGGFTDRMDCQMVMSVFAYIYHQSFVVPQDYSVEMILDQIRSLSLEEQQALFMKLGQVLKGRQFGQS
ncbi:hypothetical protein FNV43_RR04473 [Rhamnella rubrinervis]|uniref:phosphatidate cytidylyltransferase n=1 Tax=Rhamnella rubrinervis TaxID=2594499 RepID=A0A8K0MQ99_9ROSA|nr:hypothetical protein FNV43_RR04473 [Rhamnella rubrinervis]